MIVNVYRLGVAAAALALAVLVGASAGVEIWRKAVPTRVLRLLPNDGVAAVADVNRRMSNAPDPLRIAVSAQGAARAALADQPLNPAALRLLGIAAIAQNRQADGIGLLKLAQRFSRRDLGTNLALIEHYSQIGNVAATLAQYDIALSTSRSAGDLLFPILTRAIVEPQISDGVARYIRGDRPWARGFLAFATAASSRPALVARMVTRAGGLPAHPDYRILETQLLQRLGATGDYGVLRAFYLRLRGSDPALPTNLAITQATTNRQFSPLTWYLADEPEIRAQVGDGAGAVVQVAGGARGIAMQRLLFLPPGRYRFAANLRFPDNTGLLSWELRCLNGKRSTVVWQADSAATDDAGMRVLWSVPRPCAAQRLTISATGGDGQFDTTIEVADLAVSAGS